MFLAKQVIYLDGNSNYNIDVFMNKSTVQFGHPSLIKNQIIKYKIVEYKDDFIKLKSNSGIIKFVKQSE
jgi:hypothetical protein